MRFLKRISSMIIAVSMVLVVGGCSTSNNEQVNDGNNFNIIYEAKQEVDKVEYSVGDFSSEMTPMHDDKKVKEGYSSKIAMGEVGEVDLSIKIIDDGEVIYEKLDEKIDLGVGKKADVKIVTNQDGNLDVEINNNK